MNTSATRIGFIVLSALVAMVWLVVTDGNSDARTGHENTSGTCAEGQPITYQVGSIDPSFDIHPEAVRQTIDEAAFLWNEANEGVLLQHDPGGELIVNLEYDDRQQLWEEKRNEQAAVDRASEHHQRVAAEYAELETIYERERSQYESLVARLETEADTHRERIRRWEAGEVQKSAERAEQINEAGRHIKALEREVRQAETQLERRRTRLNNLADIANQTQAEVNGRIETFNQQFAKSDGFNKGEFIREGQNLTIKIYQFEDLPDLRRALSHEFGHALGLEHVDEPSAIMHYRMTDANRSREHLSSADRQMLQFHCGTTP